MTDPKIIGKAAYPRHGMDVMSACYCKWVNLIVTGAHDGTLLAWNFETCQNKSSLHEEDPTCTSETPIKDSKSVDCLITLDLINILVSGTADQYLRFWNLAKGELIQKIHADHGFNSRNYDSISAMCTTEDNKYLITADTSGCLKKSEIFSSLVSTDPSIKPYDREYSIEPKLKQHWFIKAHRKVINSVKMISPKSLAET